jgi:hypothetical protein
MVSKAYKLAMNCENWKKIQKKPKKSNRKEYALDILF